MKLKIIKICVLLFSIILTFLVFNSFQKRDSEYSEINENNYLAAYGKYIYERESCNKCHTLIINENEDEKLISLDGLENKYNNSWHSLHLVDPKLMIYDSQMPSFKHLLNKTIQYSIFEKGIKYGKREWEILLKQADSIYLDIINYSGNINDYNVKNIHLKEKSELIALIGYLQSIPASETLKEIMAEKSRKDKIKKIEFEKIINDKNSIIYMDLKSKSKIDNGQKIFESYCIACHGYKAKGFIGPNLVDSITIHGNTNFDIVNVIANGGTLSKGMIAYKEILNIEEIGQVLAYIKSLKEN